MSHALELLALMRRPCAAHPAAQAKCVLADGTPACVDCARAEAAADAALPADDPRHGTYAGAVAHYVAGTPLCVPCVDVKRVYGRRHSKEIKLGRRRRVDAAPLRGHIVRLNRAGMTQADIARAAGLSPESIRFIRRGGDLVNIKTFAALAAVRPTQSTTFGRRDIAARKILALHSLGYELAWLGKQLGMRPQALANITHDYRPTQNRVTRATWDAVCDLYDTLHMTPGPSARARAMASRKGYPPPLAFDDIDDPDDVPTGVYQAPVDETGRQAEARAVRLASLQHAVDHGHTVTRVCVDLGLTSDALSLWCRRHGHTDLYAALSRPTRAGAA